MTGSRLYVFGCGHVGRSVVWLGSWLGYRVVAIDDRPDELAQVEGAAFTASALADAVAAEPIDADTAVVIVTRNPGLDAAILPEVLASPARYVGVMGSRRRWSTTRRALLDQGIGEPELARVRTPIGVELGAETPEEIALSVMAEVIADGSG